MITDWTSMFPPDSDEYWPELQQQIDHWEQRTSDDPGMFNQLVFGLMVAEHRAEAAEAVRDDSKKVQEVYRTLLVAGMREVVRLGNAPDKQMAAAAYYSHLFHLAQESGDLDKCDEAAIEAVAKRAGVPIEYARE